MFDGITFDPQRDGSRLHAQLDEVRDFMLSHCDDWWSLDELSVALGHPEASISARLRDLRKKKFGGFEIARRYVAKGQWVYKLTGRL
jgi:hypothetical protein